MTYYRRHLARIHATDYTQYARAAAHLLVDELPDRRGLVVDLGCGAGDLCETVRCAGFDYLGMDLSPDMLRIARSRYPHERFDQRSAFDLPALTGVIAIAAVGEVLNYAIDARAGACGLIPWLRDCRELLAPSGVLLFDVAGPMRADPEPVTRVVSGDDYRLELTAMTDPARRLLRRTITIEDATGTQTEIHELHLLDPVQVMAALHRAGFVASPLAQYAPGLPFARGWSGFLARVILEP